MKISLLVIDFHFPGCRSLKEKRRRMRGIRDRFGKQVNLAVCESGYQNEHRRGQWSFIALASDRKTVDRIISDIEDRVGMTVDGVIGAIHREHIY